MANKETIEVTSPLDNITDQPANGNHPTIPVDSEPLPELTKDASTQPHIHAQSQERKSPNESAEMNTDKILQLRTAVDANDYSAESDGVDQDAAKLTIVKMPVNKDDLKLAIDSLHEDENPRHVEWMMFNIFNDFLQPKKNLSVAEAAKCFDAILPDNRPDTPDDPCDKRERPENWLWMFAELIWDLAKQIPHDHESQDKILSLLEALDHLPFTQTFRDKHFWKSKLFGWEDPSRWAISDTRPPQDSPQGMTRQRECDVHLNAMAFAARCAAIDWPHYDLVVYTLHAPLAPDYATMSCDGLESEFSYVHIAAAAQWILHAGEWLWGQIRWGKNQRLEDTKRSLPPAQWVVWMRGYCSLEMDNETSLFWADVLARKMEEIMFAHGYTADMMTTWDPKKQTVHDGLWADSRYAHLFRVPGKGNQQELRKTSDG